MADILNKEPCFVGVINSLNFSHSPVLKMASIMRVLSY